MNRNKEKYESFMAGFTVGVTIIGLILLAVVLQ